MTSENHKLYSNRARRGPVIVTIFVEAGDIVLRGGGPWPGPKLKTYDNHPSSLPGVQDIEVGEDEKVFFNGRVICVRNANLPIDVNVKNGTLPVNVKNGTLPVDVKSSVELKVKVENDADHAIPVNISKIDNKTVGIT